MPYYGTDFAAQGPTESRLLALDFAKLVASGETLSAATWTIAVIFGVDALPNTRLSGAAINSGSITKQRVLNLLSGVRYKLSADVTTSAGNHFLYYAFVDGTDGASALIVEDGTPVANSNSYNSIQEIRTFANLRGGTLQSDDRKIEQYALSAMDWIETKESYYKGSRTSATQSLSWPRTGVFLNGPVEVMDEFGNIVILDTTTMFGTNAIPPTLKYTQSQLVIEQSKGIILFPSLQVNLSVRSKTIGPIKTEYSGDSIFRIPLVDAFMAPLMNTVASLRVSRA